MQIKRIFFNFTLKMYYRFINQNYKKQNKVTKYQDLTFKYTDFSMIRDISK